MHGLLSTRRLTARTHKRLAMGSSAASLVFATALPGPSTAHFDLNDKLPVVIGFVDREARLRAFLPQLDGPQGHRLVTFEKVEVLRYGGHHIEPHA